MPKRYEAMRDKFAKGANPGSPQYDAAQTKAARIYNATRGKDTPPLTGKAEPSKWRKVAGKRRG